ncbi:hypothetical protein Bca52824_013293 [Brassica carinata]|uniref:ATP-citrate synthase citrate-binding domain-containing protein n=1 Tax=Brassica carinata TaxID=52824 RepID=A0A8X8B2C3_BRACI|nr:hypothetical protein Bca52824_013293 [Brassica carinata]
MLLIVHACVYYLLQTSASLKFTVLNPKGRIWTMVAGGVLASYTLIRWEIKVTQQSLGTTQSIVEHRAPNEEEVLQYARVVIDLILMGANELVGGGIANFTDVAATFNGIIGALREKLYNL